MGKSSSKSGWSQTSTGFAKSDVSNFQTQGDILDINTPGSEVNAPQMKVFSADSSGRSNLDQMYRGEDVSTLSTLFNKRLEEINKRRTRPGLLLTRGEL